MQQKITLKLTPQDAVNDTVIKEHIAATVSTTPIEVSGYYIVKHSIDARSRKQVWINLTVQAFISEPYHTREIKKLLLPELNKARHNVIVVGAGPAGLLAALHLINKGIKPVIIERGKDVRARRRDLAALNKEGVVNPESNYCFGEGGAGTYSDGKLYTRSNKRGDIDSVLNAFVQFGAEEKILYEAHPHIGTNKLPQIIVAMRDKIIECGGEVLFDTKLTDLIIENNILKGIKVNGNNELFADAVILATGHSARDIFYLLHEKNIAIEAKPFALGVRVEHPQELINEVQYHATKTDGKLSYLPPASYSLVEQVQGKGVFSFCMCPGGIIAPAATAPNELVVNGWSPSKRNNPYANSGMVVSVGMKDIYQGQKLKVKTENHESLMLIEFQSMVEQQAYAAGGGGFVAPAQRLVDFCDNKLSETLPDCSYLPGLNSVTMNNVLPAFINTRLQEGFRAFGKKMRGYYTNDAVIVATESRTSSPVKIPRDENTLQHIQIKNLYPCGEGAGYAGGIVSAAMDGERIANAIAEKLK